MPGGGGAGGGYVQPTTILSTFCYIDIVLVIKALNSQYENFFFNLQFMGEGAQSPMLLIFIPIYLSIIQLLIVETTTRTLPIAPGSSKVGGPAP